MTKQHQRMVYALSLWRFARQMDMTKSGFDMNRYRFWFPNRFVDFKTTDEIRDMAKRVARSRSKT